MDGSKRINLNDAPRAFKIYLMLLSAAGFLLISYSLDNDFYFLYPTGKYIVENGFPVKDFLSMHSDMSIIVQQWLTDVLYYFIYSKLGTLGMLAFVCICYAVFSYLFFKLLMLITENFTISGLCAFATNILLATMYMRTRPQIITYILIATELYMLEKFVRTKKTKYLFVLPVISLLLINFHSSMWLMMFVFALPYAANAIPFKFKEHKQEPCCSFSKLLICGIICLAVGFINPYTYKSMLYIFTSFGISEINNNIVEMQPATFANSIGKVFFAIIIVMLVIIILTRKNNIITRFALLFAGTAIMTAMNVKSFAYFVIGGMAAFAYYCKDFNFFITITKSKRTPKEKRKIILLVAIIVMLVLGLVVYKASGIDDNVENAEPDSESTYEDLDKVIDILDKSEDEVILFAGFNNGQYLEFNGYHPYIDGRAELFFKVNNKDFDYFEEYSKMQRGSLYCGDFIDKYHFNYLVLDECDETLEIWLNHDDRYEKVYDSENIDLYKLKEAK